MNDRDTEDMPAAEGGFLSRWSRRKQAAAAGQPLPEPPPAAALPAVAAEAPDEVTAPPLPDPATLDFADDFTAYLKVRVPPAMKRAAMKKLFSDPSFNQMDGLDVYIEDFNQIGDLPAAEAALLAHAKDVLAPSPGRRLSELVAPDQAAQAEPAEGARSGRPAAGTVAAGATAEPGEGLRDGPDAAREAASGDTDVGPEVMRKA